MHLATRFAVGDVTGPFQFPHVSAHRAWCGAVRAIRRFQTLQGGRICCGGMEARSSHRGRWRPSCNSRGKARKAFYVRSLTWSELSEAWPAKR
jgi:hypothetical protein